MLVLSNFTKQDKALASFRWAGFLFVCVCVGGEGGMCLLHMGRQSNNIVAKHSEKVMITVEDDVFGKCKFLLS